MPFPRGPMRGPQPLRVRPAVFAVGARAYVLVPGDRGAAVTLTDADGTPGTSLAAGTAVDIVAWRPNGWGDTRYRVRSAHGVEGWLASGNLRTAPVPPSGFTHRLLDQLVGAPTTVTVAEGDDPSQAHEPAPPLDTGTAPAVRDLFDRAPAQLETGPAPAGSGRYSQTRFFTESTAAGSSRTWREATRYTRSDDRRTFGVSSSMTPVTATGDAGAHPQGLHARFELATPSPNGFHPVSATLRGAERDGICALLVEVRGRIAGREQLAQVTLRAFGSTMDVRLLPAAAAHDVEPAA